MNNCYRYVFKTIDLKTLSDGAIALCPELGINPDTLIAKPLEFFQKDASEPQSVVNVRF